MYSSTGWLAAPEKPYVNKSRGRAKMQRAHFELLAAVLREQRPSSFADEMRPDMVSYCRGLCASLADSLSGTNPAFDRQAFLSACGVFE